MNTTLVLYLSISFSLLNNNRLIHEIYDRISSANKFLFRKWIFIKQVTTMS